MSWKEVSIMSQRLEFVTLATAENANLRLLCRSFNITPATAYKWLERFQSEGANGLEDRTRRPHHSPARTAAEMEETVTNLRRKHPAWGSRKLRKRLLDLSHAGVPAASTITAILQRHQLLDPQEAAKHQAFVRFERAAPNELWQMDFKGEFKLPQGRCYPLTILDDHSRFAVALQACARNTKTITQEAMIQVFRRYGLPEWITCDNGSPWGSGGRSYYTALGVWLLRLGIGISHSRPHHPQTQGKDERFHRTLEAEVLRYLRGDSLAQWQRHFDQWRVVYNTERPHEALALAVPGSRYQPSPRRYPEQLPAIEYGPADIVRKVRHYGHIKYQGREYHVGSAFYGLHVALRQTTTDGLFELFFCNHKIGSLDLRDNKLR
ncbi:MAG TPA: IS481 family transposase [Pyrinomonadaceae bacterium]|nr:IS481 family transposase [Pyrinomonadaceae bacterium]